MGKKALVGPVFLLGIVWGLFGQAALSRAIAQCTDKAIRDELNARRRYRGVEGRIFQKALRHELSAMGGLYGSDLLSASYLVQGAYTFHMTEELGLEVSVAYTRAESDLVRIVETDRGINLLKLDTRVLVYQAHMLWSIAYGKMRWFGSGISRFDLYLALGGGVTDNQSARGATFSGGLGLKFYLNSWLALRLDIRDQVFGQELLGESKIVNNLTSTLGLSIFIPFLF